MPGRLVTVVTDIEGWVEGQGFTYKQTYERETCEMSESEINSEDCDWSWWEVNEDIESDPRKDTIITVTVYDGNDISDCSILARWSTSEKQLIEQFK